MCLEYYELHARHCFSSPGLSWDAMLKMTEKVIELTLNIDMYLFVEKGMRGGFFYVLKRFNKANNNKYKKSCDNSKPSIYITFLDPNYLYRWAMCQYLLLSTFKWLNKKTDKFHINLIGENSVHE